MSTQHRFLRFAAAAVLVAAVPVLGCNNENTHANPPPPSGDTDAAVTAPTGSTAPAGSATTGAAEDAGA
jgi:hypothetical protein